MSQIKRLQRSLCSNLKQFSLAVAFSSSFVLLLDRFGAREACGARWNVGEKSVFFG